MRSSGFFGRLYLHLRAPSIGLRRWVRLSSRIGQSSAVVVTTPRHTHGVTARFGKCMRKLTRWIGPGEPALVRSAQRWSSSGSWPTRRSGSVGRAPLVSVPHKRPESSELSTPTGVDNFVFSTCEARFVSEVFSSRGIDSATIASVGS